MKADNKSSLRSRLNYSIKRVLFIAIMIIAVLYLTDFGQEIRDKDNRRSLNEIKNGHGKALTRQSNKNGQITPLVDHHTHIWSVNASKHITDPLLPAIELPADFARLLRDRDETFKQKDPSLMAKLYTEDAMFLTPSDSKWLRGEPAIAFVAKNINVGFRAVPVAYAAGDSVGYIAGYWKYGEGASTQYVTNFLLSLRKDTANGKWRIAAETITSKGPPTPEAATAEQLIKHLDAEGIKRAAVLSCAYWFGGKGTKIEKDEYARVRAENDWVAEQAARYPDRLVGFCSFNPLKDYAVEELNRCANNPKLKGLKLHFGNSGVDVLNPEHVEKVRKVFRAANDRRLPIVVDLWTGDEKGKGKSEAFINNILPAASDIPIQIAHLSASGPGYHADDALEVFANAAFANNPQMKNVYFDVAGIVTQNAKPETLELVTKRIRQLGLQRILYGTDRGGVLNDRAKGTWDWTAFIRLPLTEKEFKTITENIAPYMR